MGFIRVRIKILPPSDGREPVEVDVLVDTGAIYSLLPRQVLESVGVTPTGHGQVRTIEGRPIEGDVANVFVEIAGRRSLGMVPVIFGEAADQAALGVTALEMTGLEVDPVRGELRPVDFLMLAAIAGRIVHPEEVA
jgi:aspartyl protease family protein